MASTCPKALQIALALSTLVLAGAGGTARPTRPLEAKDPLKVDARSMEAQPQHVVLKDVVISQGDLRISADRADVDLRISADRADTTGENLQNSRWTFTGNVHMSSALQGRLQSDKAVVEFRDSQIQNAVATGNPAEFEQTTSRTGVLARGHANTIEYAVAADTIRLTTDAWIKYGENDIRAPVLVYNIRDQRLVGDGSGHPDKRVHMTILPRNTNLKSRSQRVSTP